jgi:ribosomal-protein-alanine N-acetyltransferase
MVEEDLASVVAIEQVAQAHAWTIGQFRSSVESSHHCYVLEAQQEIVAYAVTSTAADEAELLNITVALNHQRQGLGQLLLTAICTSFDASIHTLFLEVRVSNLGAIALYDALYFNEVGLRPNYYPNTNGAREDAMIMAKPLGL